MDCLPLFLCDHADEILVHEDFDEAGDVSHGVFVHVRDGGADFWRAHHATMHHAWHSDVVHEFELSGHQGNAIEGGNGLAKDRPSIGRAPLGRGIHGKTESLVADQLGIRNATAAFPGDRAVRQREVVGRLVQLFSGHAEKSFSRGGGCLGQVAQIEIRRRRLTSGGCPLIGADGCVALHNLHAAQRHAEFFGHQLGLHREHALAEVALPAESRHRAIGGDREPGIQLRGIDVRAMRVEWSLACGIRS